MLVLCLIFFSFLYSFMFYWCSVIIYGVYYSCLIFNCLLSDNCWPPSMYIFSYVLLFGLRAIIALRLYYFTWTIVHARYIYLFDVLSIFVFCCVSVLELFAISFAIICCILLSCSLSVYFLFVDLLCDGLVCAFYVLWMNKCYSIFQKLKIFFRSAVTSLPWSCFSYCSCFIILFSCFLSLPRSTQRDLLRYIFTRH